MPVPRIYFAVAVLNDSLLVMGGYNKRRSFICDWFETIIIINAFAGHLAPGSSSKVLMPSVWQPAGLHTTFVTSCTSFPCSRWSRAPDLRVERANAAALTIPRMNLDC